VLEVRQEDIALRPGILGDRRPGQVLHELENAVGVGPLGLTDDHGIDR
jgi:hypothetical protein